MTTEVKSKGLTPEKIFVVAGVGVAAIVFIAGMMSAAASANAEEALPVEVAVALNAESAALEDAAFHAALADEYTNLALAAKTEEEQESLARKSNSQAVLAKRAIGEAAEAKSIALTAGALAK